MEDQDGTASSASSADNPADLESFAAHCAHEFNNLLTGILGNLELMQSRAKRNAVTVFDGYLEGARNSAGRAADFTQRLLAFSGRAIGDSAPVPVNALVVDLVEVMREQGFEITTALESETGMALCDPVQLELALTELLNNAREAVAKGGAVSIATRRQAGQVIITVADTGTGMTPDTASRAATPFFTTRPGGGTGKGLGLCIAGHCARAAGGAMHLETTPDQGTTITLTLPIAP